MALWGRPEWWNNENPMRLPVNIHKTADGIYIAVIVLADHHWAPMCRATGRQDLTND